MATIAGVALIVGLFMSIVGIGMQQSHQRELQEDSQQFNSEEAQKAREWVLSPEHMQQADALGINRDIFINSILGGSGTTPSASSGIVNPQNGASALASLMSGLGANVNDAMLNPFKAENLQSETALNVIQQYWTPLLNSEKIELWSANAEAYKAQGGMYEKLGALYEEQTNWVAPLSQAEINELNSRAAEEFAQTIKAFQEAITEEHLQEWYDASSTAAYASANASNASARLSNAAAEEQEYVNRNMLDLKAALLQYNVDEAYYDKMDKYYDNVIRSQMPLNLPLSPDMVKNLWMLRASGLPDLVEVADKTWNSFLQGSADMYDREVKNAMSNYWQNMLLQFQGVVPAAAEGAAEGAAFGYTLGKVGPKGGNTVKSAPSVKGSASSAGQAAARPSFRSQYPKGSDGWKADYTYFVKYGRNRE